MTYTFYRSNSSLNGALEGGVEFKKHTMSCRLFFPPVARLHVAGQFQEMAMSPYRIQGLNAP